MYDAEQGSVTASVSSFSSSTVHEDKQSIWKKFVSLLKSMDWPSVFAYRSDKVGSYLYEFLYYLIVCV